MTDLTEATVINPFNIIRYMTDKLPDVTAQDHLLQILTLDDWVALYRMSCAAAALSVTPHEELMRALEREGVYDLCKDLAARISHHIFGDDAGTHLRECIDYQFSVTAHLQEGIREALTPDVTTRTH